MNRAKGLATLPGLGDAYSLFASPEENAELFAFPSASCFQNNAIPAFWGKSPQTFSPLLPKERLTERENPKPKQTAHPSDKHNSPAQFLGRNTPIKTCVHHGLCLQRMDPEGPQPPPWWHHVPGTCSSGAGELQLCRPSWLLPMLLAQGIAQIHFKEVALQQECFKNIIFPSVIPIVHAVGLFSRLFAFLCSYQVHEQRGEPSGLAGGT